MSVTGKTAVDAALRLICHVNAAGAVEQTRQAKYYGMAPAFLTVLQYELAACENAGALPEPVTDLQTALSLSDETALKALPAGLAMYFALTDRDSELYNHFSKVYYGGFIPGIRPAEIPLGDYYGVLKDPTLR